MPSPIQQAKLQRDFLRALLSKNKEGLRDKRLLGSIQPGFKNCPIDICIAISDSGIIRRIDTNPPELLKADSVCDRIREEIARHKKASGLLSRLDGDYGLWALSSGELQRVCEFLVERHTPSHRNIANASKLSCKHCESGELTVLYGKYSYYFKCNACKLNTAIDHACSACGKKGRVRKQGQRFDRVCEECGREELIWTNPTKLE